MKVIEDCDTLYEYRQQFSEWHFDAWQPDEPYMLNENFATVKGNWETELESMQTVGLKGEMDEYRKKCLRNKYIKFYQCLWLHIYYLINQTKYADL